LRPAPGRLVHFLAAIMGARRVGPHRAVAEDDPYNLRNPKKEAEPRYGDLKERRSRHRGDIRLPWRRAASLSGRIYRSDRPLDRGQPAARREARPANPPRRGYPR